jgi:hypothetical protein
MEIVTQDGAGLNTERLAETSKELATAARNFTKALGEIAAAVVDTMNSIDWKALGAALAAVDTGRPDAEPDENPVRFIGIRKGCWRHKRRVRCGL